MATAGVANQEFYTTGIKHIAIPGSFVPNGSTQLTNTKGVDVFGMGFSVSRTGTGVFRVTILKPFAAFVSVSAGITTDDTADHYLRVANLTLPTSGGANGYFDITHLSAADISAARWAAADITASGLLRRIHFTVVIAESDFPGAGV